MSRPKDIGTWTETAVVKYLRTAGFEQAERRALAGTHDLGDIIGTPGIVWEVKGGKAAETAGDGQIDAWLDETDRETRNAHAEIGVLVLKRKAVGAHHVGRWWAYLRVQDIGDLANMGPRNRLADHRGPVRLQLADAVLALRRCGYGQALDTTGRPSRHARGAA